MLETSKDLLFLTLAFCAILFTGFACWLMYYFIAIIRDAYGITHSLKRKIDLLDDILKTIKEQVSHMGNYLGLIISGLEKVIEYVQNKKAANAKKSKKDKADNITAN